MKNKKLLVLFLATLSVSAVGAVAATGCNSEHEHAYTWHSDSEKHWEECDCGDKKDSADHVDVKNNETGADGKDGKCDVCDYEIKQVVTFDMLGRGVAPETQNVDYGEKAVKPADPADDDAYIFSGWCKDAACETAFDFESDVVTDNITLYAKWVENKTPGESMKYAFDIELGQMNLKPLGSKGCTYYKFTATENGRYRVDLPLGANNQKCYFTTDFDDGVNYGNGYDSDVKYFDLAKGASVYVKLSCAETLPNDAQVSVTVSETVNEPLPADSWFDGLYTNGDATEFILNRESGTIILNRKAYYYNYIGGEYKDILTFNMDGDPNMGLKGTEFTFVRVSDGIYHVTATGDSSLDRKLAYFPKLDELAAVSKFGGVYEPANDNLANVTKISVQQDGTGYYLIADEFNRESKVAVNNPVFDNEYGLLKFGQFMMSLNMDGDTVIGVNLFNGDSDKLVAYTRTGDAVPVRLPLQSGTEYVGMNYRIVTDADTYSGITQKWDYNFDDPLGPDIEVTDYDRATDTYTVSISGTVYKLVFEGSGDGLTVKVYDAAGVNLLDTLTKYAAVYNNLPLDAAGEVAVPISDFRKGIYHFKATATGWYEFNCTDVNLEIYYNLNGEYPTQLYRGTKLDFTDGAQTVYLEKGAIVGVKNLYTENVPETVLFTAGAGLPPKGTDESNPYELNGEGSVSVAALSAGTKLYVEFNPSEAGKYLVCVSGSMFQGGAANGYRFHYTVGATEVGWNSATFQWLGGLTNDDHYYKLSVSDTNPVTIEVDGNDDFSNNVTVTVISDYISDATTVQFQNAGSTADALNKTAVALRDGTYLIENTYGSDLTVTANGSFTAKVNGVSANVTGEGNNYTLTVPSGTNLYVTLDLSSASMVFFNLTYPAGSEQYPYEVDLSAQDSYTAQVMAGNTYFKFKSAGNVIVACDYCSLSLNGAGKSRNTAFAVEAGDVLVVSASAADSVEISVAPEVEGLFTAEQVGTYSSSSFPSMTLILNNDFTKCSFTLNGTQYGVTDIQLNGDTYTITCNDGRKPKFQFNPDGTIKCTDSGIPIPNTLTKTA